MCMMAGYIGNRTAAPILLEMLKRQEGFAGGYYSGLATLDEGRLSMEKVVGDVENLCSKTAALSLPGTIGIAHSRTPNGGGREWAHPFVDEREELAYIANGAGGKYVDCSLLFQKCLNLMESGCRFCSAQREPVKSYPALDNGLYVHSSDLMCQAIADAYTREPALPESLLRAGCNAYESYPAEITGLCLHAAHPDEIVILRHNKPLMVGRNAEGEFFFASCSLGFPEGVEWRMRMPPLSGARFLRNGEIVIRPFSSPKLMRIGEFPSPIRIEKSVLQLLREHGACSMQTLFEAAAELYPENVLSEKETIVFEALAALNTEEVVTFPTRPREPLEGQPVAPQVYADFKR